MSDTVNGFLGRQFSLLGFSDRRTKLGALVLDILTSEELNLPSEVSRYPVEDGSTISDHITQGSETLRISGFVSSADVLAFAFLRGAGPGNAKLVDAIGQLRTMHAARALVTVSTGQMRYEGYAFANLRAVRSSSDGGNWLEVEAELVQVRKVTLKTADVPESTAKEPAKGRSGKTQASAGKASAKPVPTKSSSDILKGRDNVDDNVEVAPSFGARAADTLKEGRAGDRALDALKGFAR